MIYYESEICSSDKNDNIRLKFGIMKFAKHTYIVKHVKNMEPHYHVQNDCKMPQFFL